MPEQEPSPNTTQIEARELRNRGILQFAIGNIAAFGFAIAGVVTENEALYVPALAATYFPVVGMYNMMKSTALEESHT